MAEQESSIQRFDDQELQAIKTVLESASTLSGFTDKFLGGEQLQKFEEEFARYLGVSYAIAVNSGTSALFLALKYLTMADKVAVPAIGFTADTSMVLATGNVPVYQDINPYTYTMETETTSAEWVGDPDYKVAIPIHLCGQPVSLEQMKFFKDSRIRIIEDTCQAIGAKYPNGRMCGSFGDVGVFSFQETKTLTTLGEGGMMVTNQGEVRDKLRELRNHGEHYAHSDQVGFNFRMTEVQASVGRVQLKKLPGNLKDFEENVRYIMHHMPTYLTPPEISTPGSAMMILPCRFKSQAKHIWHKRLTVLREEAFDFLTKSGLPGMNAKPGRIISTGVKPQYTIGAYKPFSRECPVAQAFAEESIYMDIHRWRTREDVALEMEILQKCEP